MVMQRHGNRFQLTGAAGDSNNGRGSNAARAGYQPGKDSSGSKGLRLPKTGRKSGWVMQEKVSRILSCLRHWSAYLIAGQLPQYSKPYSIGMTRHLDPGDGHGADSECEGGVVGGVERGVLLFEGWKDNDNGRTNHNCTVTAHSPKCHCH